MKVFEEQDVEVIVRVQTVEERGIKVKESEMKAVEMLKNAITAIEEWVMKYRQLKSEFNC